ncbi:MAG: discoidin domain-containing protein [Prolixibacteraceae bacterium]|nr:discoidin domain-containing protein [Prolixibacteraceae bacterium]
MNNRTKTQLFIIIHILILFALFITCSSKKIDNSTDVNSNTEKTGNRFAPKLVKTNKYRNIALHSTAFHSSSYDYNLTAQHVTDGIIDNIPPLWLRVTSSQTGKVAKEKRDFIFDRDTSTGFFFDKTRGWIKLESNHFAAFNTVNRFIVRGKITYRETESTNWKITLSTSEKGIHYEPVKTISGNEPPGKVLEKRENGSTQNNVNTFTIDAPLDKTLKNQYFKLDFQCNAALKWEIDEWGFFSGRRQNEVGGPYIFTSAWKSEGSEYEWVTVDFGRKSKFNKVKIYWLDPAKEALLEISKDGETWETFETISDNSELINELKFRKRIKGRYLRINMLEPLNEAGYSINEIEVFGKGGLVPKPAKGPVVISKEKLLLSGGNWKLQRSTLANENATQIALTGYDDSNWITATVPATVLTSYFNAGIIPDPSVPENQPMISKSFFYADFWYRNEFVIPEPLSGKSIHLHFDGICPKAEIFVNGEKIGSIDTPDKRSRFEITQAVNTGKMNAIAVRIFKNIVPGNLFEQHGQALHPPTSSCVNPGITNIVYITSGNVK